MVSKARLEELSAEAVRQQQHRMGVFESDHFMDWKRGDKVSLSDEAGVFTFMSVRLDSAGNVKWANLYGGPIKQEMWRSVDVERLEKFTKIKRRGRKKITEGEE